jgi:hypothetical protein
MRRRRMACTRGGRPAGASTLRGLVDGRSGRTGPHRSSAASSEQGCYGRL